MARNTPGPNAGTLDDLLYGALTTATDGKPALAVTNTDGSAVGSGTGTGSTQIQGNVASGATDSGNPVKGGGVFNTSKPTVTTGQRVDNQSDANGNLYTRESYAPVYEDNTVGVAKVEQRFTYATSTTATTTVVKSGAGFIHTLTLLGGTAGAITVYDNTAGSGTAICPTFTPGSVSVPATITLDASFATGLTIVTAAATVITVSYR